MKHVFIGPPLRLIFKPIVEGLENIPEKGPAIMAANHLSFSDWLFMPIMMKRRMTYVGKAEYFTTPGIKGRLQKFFFSSSGTVPIDRTSGSTAEDALATGNKVLDQGELFGIFTEGTRSPDGRLYKGKTGVARLALRSGVPVIPVAIIGTNVVAPPGKVFGKYTHPIVRFGKPMDFSRYYGMENDRFVLRSITDEIQYEIMLLGGQEYVDTYAPRSNKSSFQDRARAMGEKATQWAGDARDMASEWADEALAFVEDAREQVEARFTESPEATAEDKTDSSTTMTDADADVAAESATSTSENGSESENSTATEK